MPLIGSIVALEQTSLRTHPSIQFKMSTCNLVGAACLSLVLVPAVSFRYDHSAVRWCITVPAGLSQSSMTTMREAAMDAGIISTLQATSLKLATEPEAAALAAQQRRDSLGCKTGQLHGRLAWSLEKPVNYFSSRAIILSCSRVTQPTGFRVVEPLLAWTQICDCSWSRVH